MSPLSHPKTKPLTRARAVELGLEPSFIDFIFNDQKAACFRYWCESRDRGWTCSIPDGVDVAYPLWSCNADQTLLFVSKDGISFARGAHDDPDVQHISFTSQGLLAHLLNQLYESETTESELQSAAEFSGFRFLPEYLEFVGNEALESLDWTTVWQSFVQEIDRKSGPSPN